MKDKKHLCDTCNYSMYGVRCDTSNVDCKDCKRFNKEATSASEICKCVLQKLKHFITSECDGYDPLPDKEES